MRLLTLTILLTVAAANGPAQSPPSTAPVPPRRPVLANTRLGELLPLPLNLPSSRAPKAVEQLPPPVDRPPAFSPYSVIRYDASTPTPVAPTVQPPYEYFSPTPYRAPNRSARQRPQFLPPPAPDLFSKTPVPLKAAE